MTLYEYTKPYILIQLGGKIRLRKRMKKISIKEERLTFLKIAITPFILGFIILIFAFFVQNKEKDAKKKSYRAEEMLMIDAARLYDIENNIGSEGVSVAELKKAGYLNYKENDFFFSDKVMITVTKEGSTQKKYVMC